MRGTKPIDRVIDKPSKRQRTLWQLANYGLANLIIAGIGIGFFVARRRARNAYTVIQVKADNK